MLHKYLPKSSLMQNSSGMKKLKGMEKLKAAKKFIFGIVEEDTEDFGLWQVDQVMKLKMIFAGCVWILQVSNKI